jgi:hypothetical protein
VSSEVCALQTSSFTARTRRSLGRECGRPLRTHDVSQMHMVRLAVHVALFGSGAMLLALLWLGWVGV